MNAIPYFDYSLAPFWPSYQNKVIGVLERALREQSGSRIRRILLRLPWEHDNAFNSRQTWFGMDFIETVSALMNAKPGRDLCWLLTRHPEKPEYHVVLCVRQEYFDGPELDRLILDAWSNVLGFASPGEAKPYRSRSPGMWYWIAGHRTAKPCLRTLSGRSVISPAIAVECAIRKPVALPAIPVGSAESSTPSHSPYYPILHKSH